MLLQKTSWHIKRFVSCQRSESQETIGIVPDHGRLSEKQFAGSPQRLSWLSQTHSSEVAMLLRRSSSDAASRSLQLVLPANVTPYSSGSSLCSCNCATKPLPNINSLSKAHVAKYESTSLYPLSCSSLSDVGDVSRWQLEFSDPFERAPTLHSLYESPSTLPRSTIVAESVFDLKEALEGIGPGNETVANDTVLTQSFKKRNEKKMHSALDNVQRLPEPTTEVTQAVNSAPARTIAVSDEWFNDEDAPTVRDFAIARTAAQDLDHPSASTSKPVLACDDLCVEKGAKRTRFMKRRTNVFNKPLRIVPPSPGNVPSRRTLTDMTTNMADVFSRKIFRTEVDEMLTPGRLQKLKDRVQESFSPSSIESSHSQETDGKIQPSSFHLGNLPNRLSAVEGRFPAIPALDGAIPLKHTAHGSRSPKQRRVTFADLSSDSQSIEGGMTFADLTFPSPPQTPRRHSASPSSGFYGNSVPLLPTVTEISPLSLSQFNHVSPIQQPYSKSTSPSSPFSYLLLPSTPFTAIAPQYQHGAIRIEHIRRPRKDSSPMEVLDWTAFQMAISGTADHDSDGAAAFLENEHNEDELEALFAWISWLPFSSDGTLADEAPALEIYRAGRDIVPPLRLPTKKQACETPVSTMSRVSNDSLPLSPMLDLSHLAQGEEVIPMGFNLGHDLGDFLRWEAEQVQSVILDE